MVKFKNIPTRFRGVNYRSRLEAKWGAFFHRLRWPVAYEPIDLNGWIPDFVIDGYERVLVEVKPVWSMEDALFRETAEKLESKVGDDDNLLILGINLIDDGQCIGWISSRNHWGGMPSEFGVWERGWCEAPFQVAEGDFVVDFCGGQDMPDGFVSGYSNHGGWWLEKASYCDELQQIKELWLAAGNDVQWARK